MSRGPIWTDEENDFLINDAKGLTDKEIAELLGRSEPAIWKHRLALRKQGKFVGRKEREDICMNVAFDQINCQDAANRIGVSLACVQRWCRENIINSINVGDGYNKPRYLLEEDEVSYIQDLVKKFGVRKAMLWYRKDKSTRYPKPKQEEKPIDVSVVNTEDRLQQVMPGVAAPKTEVAFTEPKSEKDSALDKVTRNIMYIQDIKERLEDLEAEKQQLLAELKECQEEVMSYIGM